MKAKWKSRYGAALGAMLSCGPDHHDLRKIAIDRISKVLRSTRGNQREAARQMGVHLTCIQKWLKAHPDIRDEVPCMIR